MASPSAGMMALGVLRVWFTFLVVNVALSLFVPSLVWSVLYGRLHITYSKKMTFELAIYCHTCMTAFWLRGRGILRRVTSFYPSLILSVGGLIVMMAGLYIKLKSPGALLGNIGVGIGGSIYIWASPFFCAKTSHRLSFILSRIDGIDRE